MKQTSVTDATVWFFIENYPAGMALDINSDSWKDLENTERKKLRNLFASIKRAVRMVLMHTDSYPLIPEDPSQYKEFLRRTATVAEERIRKGRIFSI